MRTTAPAYKDIDTISITRPLVVRLDNGIPLYVLNAGTEEIIRITLLFNAGSISQPAPLVAFAANSMLTEGSDGYTADQISEISDFYGACITCSTDRDSATVSLLTLRRHLGRMLELLAVIVRRPAYRSEELQAFTGRHSQQFLIEQSKNRNIAHRQFVKALFGNRHPYGYGLQLSDFRNLTVGQLQQFHAACYHPAGCRIIASGSIREDDTRLINRYLGDTAWQAAAAAATPACALSASQQFHVRVTKEGSLQSSIRIGKEVCNRLHGDFFGLSVVNTLLGGYFGSRLMRNIREDKGYTYGVSSLLVSLRQAGYISIVTDVGAEVTQAALREIYTEIERLQQDLVPDGELQTVRTCLMSEMLRSFDGPFAQAESLIALLEYEHDGSYYEQYLNCVKNINAKEIRKLAQQYLAIDRIYEIVVG
jgi:predicted Zn-dependent peptidase